MSPQFGRALLKDLTSLDPLGEFMQASIAQRLCLLKKLTYYWRAVLFHLKENILGKPWAKQAKNYRRAKIELLHLHKLAVTDISSKAIVMLRNLSRGHLDAYYLGKLVYRIGKFNQLVVDEVESQFQLL